MTIKEAIIYASERVFHEYFTLKDLANTLNVNYNSLRRTVREMLRAGYLYQDGRGRYYKVEEELPEEPSFQKDLWNIMRRNYEKIARGCRSKLEFQGRAQAWAGVHASGKGGKMIRDVASVIWDEYG